MTEKPYDIAKRIASDGDPRGLDEHSYVELITAQAKRENPDLSAAQAFAKVFPAATTEGALLRRRMPSSRLRLCRIATPKPKQTPPRRLQSCRKSASSAGPA